MSVTEIGTEARRGWMGLLARAPAARLAGVFDPLGAAPGFEWLRAPETGGVMVRGRLGGTGAPFNLGEMTVTRCSLSLKDGTVGHAYVQGRSKAWAVDLRLGCSPLLTCRVVTTSLWLPRV